MSYAPFEPGGRVAVVFGGTPGIGRVINIASLSSFVALTEVAAYSASKARWPL